MPHIKLNLSPQLFNPAYLPYVQNYSHRYELWYGGASSGKSHFIAQKVVIKALSSKRKILVIRKVARDIKDSVFQLIMDTLKQFQLYSSCTVNFSTYSIELPNGSIFLFKGLDNNERLKSIVGITDCWIEEATELTLDDFTQLDLRLRTKAPQQQILLSFNPVSKTNWIYKRYFEQPYSDTETIIIKTTYKDNRFLPESTVKQLQALEKINPYYYKVYALGEFASLDKLIYNNWQEQEFDYHDIKGIPINGLDFGFSQDPAALINAIADEESKTIYIYDEHCQTGLTNQDIAKMIHYKGYAKSVIIADSENKSIEELRRAGITRIRATTKGSGSINYGIQLIQQYKLIVHPKCENTITELSNYSWVKDKASGEYTDKAIDCWNHCLDALRYAMQAIEKKPTFTALPIPF